MSVHRALSATFSILGRIVGTATYNVATSACAVLAALSVSSVGSWALQLLQQHADVTRSLRLSVSSVGSWALQLCAACCPTVVRVGFQYPRSDRGHCNYSFCTIRQSPVRAFSILGRIVGTATALRSRGLTTLPPPFSILGRIVGTATTPADALSPGCFATFSILGRIVGTATALQNRSAAMQPAFQYPRSDRGHCNLHLHCM